MLYYCVHTFRSFAVCCYSKIGCGDKGISEFITEFTFDAILKLDVGTRGLVNLLLNLPLMLF